MNVSTHSDWSKTSRLLAEHESNSLYGRVDLGYLLSRKLVAGQISTLLANNLMETLRQLVPKNSLDKFIQGASYIPFVDVITLHLAQSHDDADDGLITCINKDNEIVHCQPIWSPTINYVQMEGMKGYGHQF